MDNEFAGMKDKRIVNAMAKVISVLAEGQVHKAEKYLSDKLVVRATRRTFKGKIIKGNVEILLVVGKPNFSQKEFIKECKKAGEEFPIKGVIVHFPPVKKKK